MKFWATRFESRVIGGKYFITSEQTGFTRPREFTIRAANSEGRVFTVGNSFKHLEDARDEVKRLVTEGL